MKALWHFLKYCLVRKKIVDELVNAKKLAYHQAERYHFVLRKF